MGFRIIFVFLFTVMLQEYACAQLLEKTNNSKYLKYGQERIAVNNMYPILKGKIEPLFHYDKYVANRKSAKGLGWTFLGMFGGGLMVILAIEEPADCRQRVCVTDAEVAAGLIVFASPAVGLASIVYSLSATLHKDKMIRTFNSGHGSYMRGPEPVYASIGATSNGIGLIVNF